MDPVDETTQFFSYKHLPRTPTERRAVVVSANATPGTRSLFFYFFYLKINKSYNGNNEERNTFEKVARPDITVMVDWA